MTDRTFILIQNNEEIRQKIKNEGIHVCVCAAFKDSCWLDYSTVVGNGVHGVGYHDSEDDMGFKSQKEALDFFLYELKNPVWCKDVDEFIRHIKEYLANK